MKYRHLPMDVLVKNNFYGNIDKSLWCYDEQNNQTQMKYKLAVDTAVYPLPMVDILLVILFVSIV